MHAVLPIKDAILRRPKTILAIASIVLIALGVGLPGCSSPKPLPFNRFENLPELELDLADQSHLIEIARATLAGTSYKKRVEEARNVYHEHTQVRPVFVSVLRPRERARTAFGEANTLEKAVVEASKLLKRVADDPKLLDYRIRIDVVNVTGEIQERNTRSRWRFDIIHEGFLFNSDPLVTALPQEIIGYEVIDKKGKFQYGGMRRLIKERVLGRIARPFFEGGKDVEFLRFKAISFVEKASGGVDLLIGMNYFDMPLSPEDLIRSAIAGGEYLKRNVNEMNGEFNYRYLAQRDYDSKSYNLLRHAGSVYAMYAIYEATRDPDLLRKADAAKNWMLTRLRGPNDTDKAAGEDFLVYVDPGDNEAKTGGAALAIYALAKHAQVTGSREHLAEMQKLARFIDHCTDENGQLLGKYHYDQKRRRPFISNYYPGEAVAALTRLNALDGDEHWLELATRLATNLKDVRDYGKDARTIFTDHWLCIGMNELATKVEAPELVQHVFLIGDGIADEQLDGPTIDVVGSYLSNPVSTHTAVRTEALMALTALARRTGDSARAEKYWRTALKSANIHRRMQFTDVGAMFFPAPHKALGGVMERYNWPAIQIDDVWHNSVALLELWRESGVLAGADPTKYYGHLDKYFPQPGDIYSAH